MTLWNHDANVWVDSYCKQARHAEGQFVQGFIPVQAVVPGKCSVVARGLAAGGSSAGLLQSATLWQVPGAHFVSCAVSEFCTASPVRTQWAALQPPRLRGLESAHPAPHP